MLAFFLSACGSDGTVVNKEQNYQNNTYAEDIVLQNDAKNVGIDNIESDALQETETFIEEKKGTDAELIIMRVLDNINNETEYGDIKLESLSLETGQCREIAVFPNCFHLSDSPKYPQPFIRTFGRVECRNGNFRDLFSEDYTKAAAGTYDSSINERHAGWIDVNGNFTNITENFREKFPYNYGHGLSHIPMGFDEDYFYFEATEYTTDTSYTVDGYRIRVDDETGESLERFSDSLTYYKITYQEHRVWSEDPNREQDNVYFRPTEWLDETHVLGDELSIYLTIEPLELSCESYIVLFDTQMEEISSILPKEYGMSRNGVISPDGKSVAFLMNPVVDQFDGLGIYIKDLSTDEIVPVKTDLPEQVTDVFYIYDDKSGYIPPKLSLLEWR